jgi:hypothetical protein
VTALALVGAHFAAAACPEPLDGAALAGTIERAESQFASLDPAGFVDALREASIDLPCLAEPVSPDLAARYHTLVGLELYGAGRLEDARGSFAAARAAAPERGLPAALVPAGHELHGRFAEAPIDGPRAPVPPPAVGDLLLDGHSGDSRPADRPVIAQRVDGGGAVTDTRYLLPTDPLPPYEVARIAAPPIPQPAPDVSSEGPTLDLPRARRHRPPWGWLGAAAVAGAGSLTLKVLGDRSAARFRGDLPETVDQTKLENLQLRTNLLYVGAGVAGVAAAGGTAGFAIGWAAGGPGRAP